MTRRRKRERIDEAFIVHRLSMRRSPAWRVLPDHARRVMAAFEEEHMAHGGAQNGALVCTYVDLQAAGVPRKAIALALRQLEALGFIRVVERGRPSISEYRSPSRYQLTYAYGRSVMRGGETVNLRTDDWTRFSTLEEAWTALKAAATLRSAEHVRRAEAVKRKAAQAKTAKGAA